jgi:hypothetical protein
MITVVFETLCTLLALCADLSPSCTVHFGSIHQFACSSCGALWVPLAPKQSFRRRSHFVRCAVLVPARNALSGRQSYRF